jgi:hypothetical protein
MNRDDPPKNFEIIGHKHDYPKATDKKGKTVFFCWKCEMWHPGEPETRIEIIDGPRWLKDSKVTDFRCPRGHIIATHA